MDREYPSNLCTLTKEEQESIQADKARWLLAHKMISKNRAAVIAWLATVDDEQDMRNRLNKIKAKRRND